MVFKMLEQLTVLIFDLNFLLFFEATFMIVKNNKITFVTFPASCLQNYRK